MSDSLPTEPEADESVAVDYEQSPEVRKMLANAPHALPLPAKLLMENKLSVGDIPAGILLNHYVGDLEVRVTRGAPKFPKSSPLQRRVQEAREEQDLIRTAREGTNKGRKPGSRRYIRGVLHTHPILLTMGAIATMLLVVALPATVASAVLLILSVEMPQQFEWVAPEFLWVPAASLLVVGMLYLSFGLSSRCRICNQRLYVYQSRFKNEQAHHLPGMGYVLPMCIHLLLFRWFRCCRCGTSVRLKK